jgi:hypothetical protein
MDSRAMVPCSKEPVNGEVVARRSTILTFLVPHPKIDTPIGTLRSVEKQAQLKLR